MQLQRRKFRPSVERARGHGKIGRCQQNAQGRAYETLHQSSCVTHNSPFMQSSWGSCWAIPSAVKCALVTLSFAGVIRAPGWQRNFGFCVACPHQHYSVLYVLYCTVHLQRQVVLYRVFTVRPGPMSATCQTATCSRAYLPVFALSARCAWCRTGACLVLL